MSKEVTTDKQYINIDRMVDRLFVIFKDARDGLTYEDDDEQQFVMEEYSDDSLNERASGMAYEFNRDMGKYLNASSHKIDGNFNNIDYDYPAFRTGNVEYDFDMVNDMIARLNNQDMSEQSVKDRDFLVDWFFETFGTFGISYNFTNEISDACYQYQQEKKDGSNNRNI